MARKTDPVTRLKRELADLDSEIAGLEAQAQDAERALSDARRTMRTANLDEGLASVRQGRETVVDLAEVLAAKRDQRRAKADELAQAQADAAAGELRRLRQERDQAAKSLAEAAQVMRDRLDAFHEARGALNAHISGLDAGDSAPLTSDLWLGRLIHWVAANGRHFGYHEPGAGQDPERFMGCLRPIDDPAVVQSVETFRQLALERAQARLRDADSDDQADDQHAA